MNRGVVVAVGPGTKDEKTILQPGDNVVLPGYGGTAIKDGGEDLFVFRESEIIAKIQEQ